MKWNGLSQEGLKLIACVTMLIDHVGAVLVPWIGLRAIGRLAFPIYCFLLAEGAARTRDLGKYGLRLAFGMLLAELPFDLLFFRRMTLAHQSVMVTLLLGFLMIQWMQRMPKLQFVAVFVCAGTAQLLNTDYGSWGIILIAMFALTRQLENRLLIQSVAAAVLCWLKGGMIVNLDYFQFPLQFLGVFAMVPIALYSGRKATSSKAVQWLFYLFYPVHLLVLLIIKLL